MIKLGDTIYADLPPPPATTLDDFRLEHSSVYASHFGVNYWAAIQATAPILAMIDDHEVANDFAGGAARRLGPSLRRAIGRFHQRDAALPQRVAGVQ